MNKELAEEIRDQLAVEAHQILQLIVEINERLNQMTTILEPKETKPFTKEELTGNMGDSFDTYRIYPDGELYHEDDFDEIEGDRLNWYYDEVTIKNMPNLGTEEAVYNFVHRAIMNQQRTDK